MLYGGILISGIKVPFPELYYLIPPSLANKAKLGKKVLVPYGESDTLRVGYLLKISESLPKTIEDKDIKEVWDIFEEELFNEDIAKLINFTSDTFLIPVHKLFNEIYGSTSTDKISTNLKIINTEKANEAMSKSRSKIRNELINLLLERKEVTYNILKRAFGNIPYEYIKDLESNGIICKTSEHKKFEDYLVKLTEDRQKIEEIFISNRKKKSTTKLIGRFLQTENNTMPISKAITGIKNGRKILQDFINNGILIPIEKSQNKSKNKGDFAFNIFLGGSFEARNRKICEWLKINLRNNDKAIVIFPELNQIKKAAKIYEEYFNKKISIWDGSNKLKILSDAKLDKKIIITTNFSLFLNIPDLKFIVLEDASSKYYRPGDFVPYDSRLVAYKKATIESKELLFSCVSLDDTINTLASNTSLKSFLIVPPKINIKTIDMRNEFKKRNYGMLSWYVDKMMKKELEQGKNVALLLNRKPYSTFIMCRECGFVVKCPVCKSTLYYDINKNKLYCPVCGYSHDPFEKCPRCGSISIHYFGGGIQKLERELKKRYSGSKILTLMSNSNKVSIINSSNFSNTIFLGTEFMLSHLNISNVSLFVFVSIDTFINSFDINAAFNAFKISAEAIFEMDGREIVFQTYSPDSSQIKSIQKLDNELLLNTELYLREKLNYPPFANLIIIKTLRDFEKANTLTQELRNALNESYVLGPTVSQETFEGIAYETTIKSRSLPGEIYEEIFKYAKKIGAEFKLFVYPAPNIVLRDISSENQELLE